MKCPQSYSYVSGGCYKIPVSTSYTWFDAAIACQQQGAYLATVDNEVQRRWLATYYPGYAYFIGLNDISVEGQFTWLDGSNLTNYEHFATGYPNGGSASNCVAMISGYFYDYSCHTYLSGLCQWNATIASTTQGKY